MEIKFNSRELSSVRHFEGKFCIIGIRVVLHYSLTLSTQIVQTICGQPKSKLLERRADSVTRLKYN
jgi:hypothetical protein